MSMQYGKTFIITNAAEGWVQFSAQRYMPKAWTVISKLTVISARAMFEEKNPGDCHEWKM